MMMQDELFGSTQTKSKSNSFQTFSSDHTDYTLVETKAQLDELCSYLEQEKVFAFDTETDSVNPITANLVGISVAVAEGVAWYVPFNSMGLASTTIIEALRPYFEDSQVLHVAHNYKFDYKVLKQHGIELKGDVFDTMLAGYLLDHDQRVKMDKMAKKYLSYDPISIDHLLEGDRTLMDVPVSEVFIYAAEDADVTYQLYTFLKDKIKDEGLHDLAIDIEFPVAKILAKMELDGVMLNTTFMESYLEEIKADADKAEQKMYDMAGQKFNPRSPQQVGEILYDHFGLPVIEKTKTGNRATGADVLKKLSDKHEFPKTLLEYREVHKLYSTYLKPIPEKVNESTGRLHTDFVQHRTSTGRLSSRSPNLQNIPIRTERGRRVRKAFVAPKGRYILNADYSQMELRIIASICQDPNMLKIFREGKDIHSGTAAEIYDVSIEDVTDKQRYKAKTINYALPYGAGARKVSKELQTSQAKAEWLLNNYFEKFPDMKNYIDGQHEFVKEYGYVETRFGRRRWLPGIYDSNQYKRFAAQREATNMPIQGESADIMKSAMVAVDKYIKQSNQDIKLLLQVHDELVLEIPKKNADIISKSIVEAMENAEDIGVPLGVDYGISKSWFGGH